uniref:Uncharacterized protein n=1 Tax=Anguilla anguilla TaxID=7936 RepID=A0A0E9XKY6_ANGAN
MLINSGKEVTKNYLKSKICRLA